MSMMIPSSTSASDVRVVPFNFTSTEITLEAVSAAGRALFSETFGAGAVSITLRKSQLVQFSAFCTSKGVCVGTFAV